MWRTRSQSSFLACTNGHYSTVHLLINNGVLINLCLKNVASPLFVGCREGHYNVVQLLLSKEADINLSENFYWKMELIRIRVCKTELVLSRQPHESIVKMLLRSGAYINLYEQNNFSPMSIACRKGYASIVQLYVVYATGID